MKFTPIEIKTWPIGQMFNYFSKMAPTSYSLTVEVDVTELLKTLKTAQKKFFPTYLWLVTKCLNKQQEFKIAYQGETLEYYDKLTPLYASFHDDDKTFSLMWSEYDDDYNVYNQNYCSNQEQYGKKPRRTMSAADSATERLHGFLRSVDIIQAFCGSYP